MARKPKPRWCWWVMGFVLGCAGAGPARPGTIESRRATGPAGDARSLARPPEVVAPSRAEPSDFSANLLAQFEAIRIAEPDLDYEDLVTRFRLQPRDEPALGFDPTQVQYFDEVARTLALTAEERAVFRQRGVVSVDHDQRYSMGGAYYAIYTRDLPVLITSDSILHALHRSFDEAMLQLEQSLILPALADVFGRTLEELRRTEPTATEPDLRQSLEDVDLYFTVAWNLLAGAGAPADEALENPPRGAPELAALPDRVLIPPRIVASQSVAEILKKIAALRLETSKRSRPTSIYGGQRYVDWSQFRPRGHYTRTVQLRRFFRAMTWLGRADTGFVLSKPDPITRMKVDPVRERRNAMLAVMLLEKSGALPQLENVTRLIDLVVGRSDNVGIPEVKAALGRAELVKVADLAADDAGERFHAALNQIGARGQQIRGQVLESAIADPTPTPLPLEFQVFGQRFAIDSFVLSRVVYDSIVYRGEKMERFMPQGLDVMAAFGNDEATKLLEAPLREYKYASNLNAARRAVDSMTDEDWEQTVYGRWLSSLRVLDDEPPSGAAFPAAMRGEAWRRKQLRTALSSWTELRHDTILYAKQSYTSSQACEYPAGFVEPYPEFFARVASLSEALSSAIRVLEIPPLPHYATRGATQTRDGQVRFFSNFAATARRLRDLARLELASKPFSQEDEEFLKKTIDIRGFGSGPPRYDGWYPRLIYGERPDAYLPVVADVHTDPNRGTVLHEAVGDTQFLIVAVDNGPHRRVYVGPAYSYYEFTLPAEKRLTDHEWEALIRKGKTPEPPSFTRVFAPKGLKRAPLR